MKPTVIAVGNLTKDVVFEKTKTNGVPVAKFTVACNSGMKDDRRRSFGVSPTTRPPKTSPDSSERGRRFRLSAN